MQAHSVRFWLALAPVALAGCVGCRTSEPSSARDTTASATDASRQPAAPCEEGRTEAKLLVLVVDAMDEATALRIEAMLAEKFSVGIVSASANPSTKLVTVLARSDADIDAATTIDLMQALGLQAREADEAAYEAAVTALGSRTASIPATEDLRDGNAPQSSVQSLEASLSPLQSRFNDDKGLLRFIALLSPT